MALYYNLNRKSLNLFRYCIAIYMRLPQNYSQHLDKTLTLDDVNVIDHFTSQLIEKKIWKWEKKKHNANKNLRDNNNTASNLTEKTSRMNYSIEDIGAEQITLLFQHAIDRGDYNSAIDLIKQCIKYEKCPSLSVLICVLTYCSQNGDVEIIKQITNLCSKCQPEVLSSHSDFKHYIAEATWIKGNITKSLELFENVYRNNTFLRRRIRLMLKYLILDIVSTKSEAALINIISFSERLLKDFKDFYPLTCIWQVCFLSEWYTDQCIALDLLEKNDGLFKSVVNRIPYVVFISLRYRRSEIVYRLLELLLKHEMKAQYGSVLVALLDYQFRCGDLRSCSEIIQWSIENDVDLPSGHHVKLINLLLNETMQTPFARLKSNSKENCKYDLKF